MGGPRAITILRKLGRTHNVMTKGNYHTMSSAGIRCPEKRPHDAWLSVLHSGQFDLYRVGITYEEGKLFSLLNEETALAVNTNGLGGVTRVCGRSRGEP